MNSLRVHRRIHIDASGAERIERVVDCPAGRHPVSTEACGRCGYASGEAHDEQLDADVIDCERERGADPASESYETSLPVVPVVALASRDVICAAPEAPIASVRRAMLDSVVGCVPVVNDAGHVVGVVSAVDLVRYPDAEVAADAMSSPVACVADTTAVTRAAAIMAFEGIHHLPVVSEGGTLVGVLSSIDVLYHLGQAQGYLVTRGSRRRAHVLSEPP